MERKGFSSCHGENLLACNNIIRVCVYVCKYLESGHAHVKVWFFMQGAMCVFLFLTSCILHGKTWDCYHLSFPLAFWILIHVRTHHFGPPEMWTFFPSSSSSNVPRGFFLSFRFVALWKISRFRATTSRILYATMVISQPRPGTFFSAGAMNGMQSDGCFHPRQIHPISPLSIHVLLHLR